MSVSFDITLDRLLREVMPRRLHKLPLKESTLLQAELGLDSIGLLSLAFRIEEEFQVDLLQQTDRIANIRTMGDVRDLVLALAGGGAK